MLSEKAMRKLLAQVMVFWTAAAEVLAGPPLAGSASWYGDEHRGKLMANGQRFDPDKLTAASWFYRLGTKVHVTAAGSTNRVEVIITDRGPNRQFIRQGRIIDLSRAAFERLANRDLGVIEVTVGE
jgi:rare lipoprotein A